MFQTATYLVSQNIIGKSIYVRQTSCTIAEEALTSIVAATHNSTVKPSNKGHVGDNINSHALSLVEWLSSSRRFKLYCYYRDTDPMNCLQ